MKIASKKTTTNVEAPITAQQQASDSSERVIGGLKRATSLQDVTVSGYQCSELFGRMVALFREHSDLVNKFKVTYVFDLINDHDKTVKKQWTLNLKNKDDCGVYFGAPVVKEGEKIVDCTMTMTDSNCYKIMTGKLSPHTAYMKGIVKVKGNIGLALKLVGLQKLLAQEPSL